MHIVLTSKIIQKRSNISPDFAKKVTDNAMLM
jgi:hypothetical protein